MMKKYLLLLLICVTLAAFKSTDILAAQKEWKEMSPLPEGRSAAAVVTVNGKIYTIGGSAGGSESAKGTKRDTTYVYDPIQNLWSIKAPMPTARAAVTAAVYNDEIYVIGGYYGTNNTRTNKVEVYNTKTDTWRTASPMSSARSWASAVTVDNKIYVIGGHDNSKLLNTVESFDVITQTWQQKNNFPVATQAKSVVYHKGNIYALGGSYPIERDNGVYRLDLEKDTWVKTAVMPQSRNGSGAFLYQDQIYVVGGTTGINDNDVDNALDNILVYNPQTNESSSFEKLSFARGQISSVVVNDEIYIIGGVTQSGIINTVEKYTIKDNSSSPTLPDDPSQEGERAILVITMLNGLEKEYDLPMSDITAFINWYDAKDTGIGPSRFAIDKYSNNKGPFIKRTDSVIFNNILTFEVSEYALD
ncbi:Kelch repeat-containing protein [Saccharibacillus sacchari]|uniref:Kelch repeat-containing protein n=1 Tax=Saccharibacillus sacchari TaxID=456493 RepID=A0ACC6PF59_9BACL